MTVSHFADRVTKFGKAQRGRTPTRDTPIAVRSRVALRPELPDTIRAELGAKLGHIATLVERMTVRFEDVNGPKGGVDVVCRIKLVMSGRPSVHVATTARDPDRAFAAAVPVLVRNIERIRAKHHLRAGRSARSSPITREPRTEASDAGEIIGRRVGRGAAGLARALERPEKQRRDVHIDTARRGVSETDRRAGGNVSARRNARAKSTRASAALEDSRSTPSRKSTRRSANRGKSSHGKERTALARSLTPSARARRLKSRRR